MSENHSKEQSEVEKIKRYLLKRFNRGWTVSKMLNYVFNKFHIIPKTDKPEDWVEINSKCIPSDALINDSPNPDYARAYYQGRFDEKLERKLKWRTK